MSTMRIRHSWSVFSAISIITTVTMSAGCTPVGGGGDGNANASNVNENTSINENENENGGTTERVFVGAATCSACHGDSHTDWEGTAHANALETLREIGQETNAACLGCHTVGFGEEHGFVDEESTPTLAGVQCENCHGPGGEHVADIADVTKRPPLDMASANCGQCHTGAHHPTNDEWLLSKHATALAGLRTNAFAGDECLECHSQDYRYAVERNAEDPSYEVPTLETAALNVECSTCHAPHGGTAEEGQLRAPVADLCGECHTVEESTLGDTPHHPQIEMLEGIGAFEDGGGDLVAGHAHSTLAAEGGQACAQCHVVRHEVEEPNEGNPNVTGHTFNPFDESIVEHQADQYTGCTNCHTVEVAGNLRTATQADISTRLTAIAPFFDDTSASYIDPATLSEADAARLSVAMFNYQFVNADGSVGVHNPSYADEALTIAEAIVADLAP